MPNIKLVIDITLDDVNEGGFDIDHKILSKIPTGGSLEIDLREVKGCMDRMMDNKLDVDKPKHWHK
jgi:hypothetical protein